jgi:hypothetical protein
VEYFRRRREDFKAEVRRKSEVEGDNNYVENEKFLDYAAMNTS